MLRSGLKELAKAVTNHSSSHVFVVIDFASFFSFSGYKSPTLSIENRVSIYFRIKQQVHDGYK